MFKRPLQRAEPLALKWESDSDHLVIRLAKGENNLPVAEWARVLPSTAAALADLAAMAEDSETLQSVEIGADEIRLGPDAVAALPGHSADALGLPSPSPLALDLRATDRIDQDSFRIRMRWVRPGGQPIRATVDGALLHSASGTRRVPGPIWDLLKAARPLTDALPKAERFEAMMRLRDAWPECPSAPLESEGYLRDIRVHYASGVSLKLKALTPDRTEFEPVLFNTQTIPGEGVGVDEDVDAILPPAAQRLFAEDRFLREPEARPVYVLRGGEYVFIDPSLRPVLNAVRSIREGSEAERRAFVLNPRLVLRSMLGDDSSDAIGLDDRFIDTEQFSDRVAGVDIWRTPVLPWLTPVGGNGWLPERFGLRIGEEYFAIPAENIAEVIERVERSAEAGSPMANVEGLLSSACENGPPPPDMIPVNDQCRAALGSLAALGDDLSRDGDASAPSQAWDKTRGKLFLVVRDNFEEVDYAPFGGSEVDPEVPRKFGPPRCMKTSLKVHQVEGFNWLVHSARCGRPGALLADDMGLGKTLQAIAFMAYLQDEADEAKRARQPLLIVAPTGLLGTWRDEIAKHLQPPRLGTLVPAFGANLKLLREEDSFGERDIETGKASLNAAEWRDAGVVLTTYETLRDYHFSFAKTRFALIIYDEIQKLKNPASQVSRAAKTLNGEFVLGMTGTPVENRLQDLWAIMDVISPGLLGASREFEKRYRPDDSEALARLKAQLTEPEGNHPQPMLRRMKSEVLEGMPRKSIHTLEEIMPPAQAQAYRDVVMRAAASGSAGNLGKGGMLTVLARMRGISLHPVDPREAPEDLDAYARDSARLGQTLSILKGVEAAREKALIFVEDLAMQERLAGLIQARFKLARRPMRINGTVPGPKRQDFVRAFQCEDGRFDVMILSPKAGGVGLTLTAANHVIHLSRWWNPAVEDQATDRVFRIGQTRDVHIHLPLAIHPDADLGPSSFDKRLDALINRKRTLTNDLFLPPDAGDAELANLFREVSLERDSTGRGGATNSGELVPLQQQDLDDGSIAQGQIRLWRRPPGADRPTPEILAYFAGQHISQVVIRDPYALVDHASREAQSMFIRDLAAVARVIDGVMIEYAPEIDRRSDDGIDRRAFGTLYAGMFPSGAPRMSLVRRLKRGVGDDFHDRFVEITVKGSDGQISNSELTIGRGVQALYDIGRQCTVTFAPPTAAR